MSTMQSLDRLRDRCKRDIRAAKMDPRRINSAIGVFASAVGELLGDSDPGGAIAAKEVEQMKKLLRAYL